MPNKEHVKPINKERVKLWVEDLRTTTVPQIRRSLETKKGNCCLGRACRVAMAHGLALETKKRSSGVTVFDGERLAFPKAVREWYGFYTDDPKLGPLTATEWNDDARKTFAEIADLVEKYLLQP
jgi:hypothetical protein